MYPDNQWINNLGTRERFVIFPIFVLICIVILKLLVWDPTIIGIETARNDLEIQQKLLHKIQGQADRVAALRRLHSQNSSNHNNHQSIGRTINNSANNYNLLISRFQAGGDKTIELWMEDTYFDNFILWLETLKNDYGIYVNTLHIIDTGKSGAVNIKVILTNMPS